MKKNISINKDSLGEIGEEAACQYLELNGYEILHRNYRFDYLEIDILAKKKSDLVIIEVKTLHYVKGVHPEHQVDRKKLDRITLAGERFLDLFPGKYTMRFDVIGVTKKGKQLIIRHFKDAGY